MASWDKGSEGGEIRPKTPEQMIDETRPERDAYRLSVPFEKIDPNNIPDSHLYHGESEPLTPEEQARLEADPGDEWDSPEGVGTGWRFQPYETDQPSPESSETFDLPTTEVAPAVAETEQEGGDSGKPLDLPAPTVEHSESVDNGEGSQQRATAPWGEQRLTLVFDDYDTPDPTNPTRISLQGNPEDYIVYRPADPGTETTAAEGTPVAREPSAETALEEDASGETDDVAQPEEPVVEVADDGRMVVTYDDSQIEVEERGGQFVPVGQVEEETGGSEYGPHTPPELTEDDELPAPKTTLEPGEVVITRDYHPEGLFGREHSEPYYARVGEGVELVRLTTPIEPEQADSPVTKDLTELPENADSARRFEREVLENSDDMFDATDAGGKGVEAMIPMLQPPQWVERVGAADLPGHPGETNIVSALLAIGVLSWVIGRRLWQHKAGQGGGES